MTTSRKQPIGPFLAGAALLFACASGWGRAVGWSIDDIVYILAGSCLVWAIPTVWRGDFRPTTILLLACIARLAQFPVEAGDDINRYLWEGWVQLQGINPYQHAPSSLTAPEALLPIWEGINGADMTAVYPPGVLLFFRALAAITLDPASMKWVAGVADLLIVWVLLDLCRLLRRRCVWVLAYALHPLVLLSFAGEGHLDSLMILPMMLGIRAMVQGHSLRAFVWLAIAIQAKYAAVVLWPFFIRRDSWRLCWITPLLCLLPFAAFWPSSDTSPGWFASFSTYSTHMHFNGGFHHALALLIPLDWSTAARVSTVLGLVGLLVWRLSNQHPVESAPIALAIVLLTATNVHFWYLPWMIAPLVLSPSRPLQWWSVTAAALLCTWIAYEKTGIWQEQPAAMLFEYLPLVAVVLLGVRPGYQRPSLADAHPPAAVHSLSVIVPVLNDNEALRTLLASPTLREPRIQEILLADGSPNASAASLLADHPDLPLTHLAVPAGRGRQIHGAWEHATADAVVILHADSLPQAHWTTTIVDALNTTGRRAGALGSRFPHRGLLLNLVGALNRLRAGWAGISFGDQVQFFRRDAFDAAGGFPALRLMEDVEATLIMKEIEQPLFLDATARTSDRAWKGSGRHGLHRTGLIIGITIWWMIQRYFRKETPDDKWFFRVYYGTDPEDLTRDV